MVQTAFGKDIAFSVRTFRFTDGQSTDVQNQTVTCEMHLEPAADVPAEQAADCTCYSVEECTGKSDERLFLDYFLKSIYLVPEFTEWTDWSECSVTCGDGERTRSRTCTAGCSNIDENDSNHSLVQAEVCSQAACGKFPYHMAQRRSRLDHSVSRALT